MCYCNNRQEYILHALIMIILMTVCGFLGIYLISDSQVQRREIPCELMNIIAFECDYDATKNTYHAVTFMSLLINNTNYTIMMVDDCNSCRACKNLYNVSHVYNCAIVNGMYKIYDSHHTTKYGSLVFGIILSILATIFAITLIVIFVKSRWYIIKHIQYAEI